MTAPGPSLPEFFAGSASEIVFRGEAIALPEVLKQADYVAQAMTRLGIGKGDRVALWLPNCPEWFVVLIAAARIGAITVMVNTRYRSAEVADIVSRSGAKALFLWPTFRGIDFAGVLGEIDPDDLSGLEVVVSVFPAGEAGEPVQAGGLPAFDLSTFMKTGEGVSAQGWPDETDLPGAGVAIFTTSGTTSKPKFVLHSQQNATRHSLDVNRAFEMDTDPSPVLQALPLCGVFGFCQALATIAAGRPLILEEAFSAGRAVSAVHDHRMTHFFATDDMVRAMLDEDETRQALRSLRMVGFAAFNGDPGVLMDRAEEHGVPLVGLYGMSEVMALFAAQSPADPKSQRIKGAGRPVCPDTVVRVRDPETGVLLGKDEVGALEIRTPNMLLEYFENPGATEDAVDAEGFLKTGDAGYLDDAGFVYLARMGDALRLGGFLVAPEEIIARIDELPEVAASQVVGILVEGKSRCAAFVISADGGEIDEDKVIAHCRAGLAAYKVPIAVWTVERFPTTPSPNGTKIQRNKLQALAQSRVDTA